MSNIGVCRTTASEPSAYVDAAPVTVSHLGRPA
jgi:hypothetical protein